MFPPSSGGQFRRHISRDASNGSYGILTYMDTKELIIKANLPRPLLIKYSVFAGEIVHQMRSALDHLFHQLVPGYVGFPFFTDEVKYGKELVPKLKGIDPSAVTIHRVVAALA